jgi:hypothetical protein
MPTVIAENENRDMFRGSDGNIAMLSGVDAVAQLAKSRMEAQRGEMKYAANSGMPTRATAWDTFNPKQFDAAARSILLGTPGVTGVQSFEMFRDGNDLNYTAVITTIYGTATVTSQ